jgi:uncharacterized protein YqfB (UPF0267 family)
MTTHKVKSWTYLFEAALSGQKTHDLRRISDRDYKVGDIMILQEFDQTKGIYTGRELPVEITYITSNNTPCALSSNGLDRDVCVLSIRKI